MNTMLTDTSELINMTDKIAEQIQYSEEYRQFWQARSKMDKNTHAQQLFEELKRKTNNLLVIRDQLGEQHPRYQVAQSDVAQLEDQLAKIPVAVQYRVAQDELNHLMQEVVMRLMIRVGQVLPVEPGAKQGCGNACSCGER